VRDDAKYRIRHPSPWLWPGKPAWPYYGAQVQAMSLTKLRPWEAYIDPVSAMLTKTFVANLFST